MVGYATLQTQRHPPPRGVQSDVFQIFTSSVGTSMFFFLLIFANLNKVTLQSLNLALHQFFCSRILFSYLFSESALKAKFPVMSQEILASWFDCRSYFLLVIFQRHFNFPLQKSLINRYLDFLHQCKIENNRGCVFDSLSLFWTKTLKFRGKKRKSGTHQTRHP